jgi:drug/metabolite transporter (DMT)-like permease
MILVILGSMAFAVLGQLGLKTGMNRIGRVTRRAHELGWRQGAPPLVAGLAAYGVSSVLWLWALSRVELSYAFPFLSLSYVAIMLAARFALSERLDRHRILGSAFIILGVILVGLSRS